LDKSTFRSRIIQNPDTIRFHTPDELQQFLQDAKKSMVFLAIPISGQAETFRYDYGEKAVTASSGTAFGSLGNFTCYAFQCDAEGCPGAEHIDLMLG
jgi:hypothetical protein